MIGGNLFSRFPTVMSPWQWGFVIVTVSLAIWLIVWLRSYFREDADDADETLEMLTQFRKLHHEGGLSDDEFRLIRSRLTRKVQAANVTGQTEPKVIAVDSRELISSDARCEAPNQSPDKHAMTEELEMSERMPDKETE